ncbi:MAG: hypothetical protein WD227_16685 [Vicinamibacterales bacterium]
MERRTPWTLRRHTVVLALALLFPACGAHPPITLPRPDLRPPSHIDQVYGYQSAVTAIAAVIERELGVPPFPVTFDFYLDDAAFEKGLRELGHDPVTARETARVMRGVGVPGRVLVNSQVLEPMSWGDRVRVLAHELVHSLQYQLAGGNRGTSEQWLREGFAEWVALMVLDRLRARPFAELRDQQWAAFRGSARSRAPRLDEMIDFPQWIAVVSRPNVAVYSQAFLAAEVLVQRHGAPAVISYFRQYASIPDRPTAFRAAFGEDPAAFEAVLEARLGIKRR